MHEEIAPLVREVHRVIFRQIAFEPVEHARQLDVDDERPHRLARRVDDRCAHAQDRQPFGRVRPVSWLITIGDR